MTNTALVNAIVRDAGFSKAQARAALEPFLQEVEEVHKAGEKVNLVGFGSFVAQERPEREGRSPRTGKPIKIPPRRVARFRPASFSQEGD
jgi:DNA-binding protein HU-beta